MRLIYNALILIAFVSCKNYKEKKIELSKNIFFDILVDDTSKILINDETVIDFKVNNLTYFKDGKEFKFIFRIGNAVGFSVEKEPVRIMEKKHYDELLKKKDSLNFEFYYVEKGELSDVELFKKRTVKIDSINNKLCKIITPRWGREGLYAIHFYSLYEAKGLGPMMLSIIGHDLNIEQENELWEIARNIEVNYKE